MPPSRTHDTVSIAAFRKAVWRHYHAHGRHDLPWRMPESDNSFDPYKIMVSELMLQQTQVARVILKYHEFLSQFPTLGDLAEAPLGEVLRAWSGLGYNRRAKFLHQAAQQIMQDYDGRFPRAVSELIRLPGIGPGTAGAVLTYAFNQPVTFIETNIRTAYIHHFFQDRAGIADAEILALVDQSLDHEHPREWYWALMDYGSYLKQTVGNLNQRSKSYAKQSKFEGSKRQIRGQILRLLDDKPHSKNAIMSQLRDKRTAVVLDELIAEGMVRREGEQLSL